MLAPMLLFYLEQSKSTHKKDSSWRMLIMPKFYSLILSLMLVPRVPIAIVVGAQCNSITILFKYRMLHKPTQRKLPRKYDHSDK